MASILIVDDSILMRRNLRILLTEAGHNVVAEASNGIEAYKEYARLQPDLVTMDITMPVMSGIDAVKKIMATYPDANIIMISALDQKNMVFEAIQNGAKHYILKPITVEKILEVIHNVLEEHDEESLEANAALEAAPAEAAAAAATQASPFGIENKNGIFIVSLKAHAAAEHFDQIGMAVQGFLFIKPLKVVFHFHDTEKLDPALAGRLESFIKQVTEAGGNAKVVTKSRSLTQQLKEQNPNLFSKIYTELSQTIM